jgi:DNA mismatch endonuclease (patch repair protein)
MRTLHPPLPKAPSASSDLVGKRMRVQPRTDTACELSIRSALHRRGFRFRVNGRPVSDYRRRADIVFPKLRIAVFIDGCFWHGCRHHASMPKTNRRWWSQKIRRNRIRDQQTTLFLRRRGWSVIRIWEHVATERATDRIAMLVTTHLQMRSLSANNR